MRKLPTKIWRLIKRIGRNYAAKNLAREWFAVNPPCCINWTPYRLYRGAPSRSVPFSTSYLFEGYALTRDLLMGFVSRGCAANNAYWLCCQTGRMLLLRRVRLQDTALTVPEETFS